MIFPFLAPTLPMLLKLLKQHWANIILTTWLARDNPKAYNKVSQKITVLVLNISRIYWLLTVCALLANSKLTKGTY